MSTNNTQNEVPSWLMIAIFILILAVLAVFGDLFTFILGALIQIFVFAAGYNKKHLGDH